MRINRLTIENIGLLSGSHSFNLKSTIDSTTYKPIVLIGGLNGAGKTTIFDAIKLCLYGKSLFYRITDEEYEQYLYDKIHYSKVSGKLAEYASVSLEFDYSHFGVLNSYNICRKWAYINGHIQESISILKDNEELDLVEQEFWQDFINELIPFGLSELFFFDGEKIQRIISGKSDTEFRNSIKSLLGIDIIERLQTDIRIYQTRNLKKKISSKQNKELNNLEIKKKNLDIEIQQVNTVLASLENDILKNENDIEKYREKIVAQGGSFLESKNDLKIEAGILENEITVLEDRLRDIASGNLPVTMLGSLARRFKKYIYDELQLRENKIADKIMQDKKNKLLSKLQPNLKNLDIKKEYIKIFKLFIENEFDVAYLSNKSEDTKEIFHFSEKLSQRIIQRIDSAIHLIPEQLKKINSEYETVLRKLQQIRRSINQAPEEELLKPMFDKMNEFISLQIDLKTKKTILEDNKYHINHQVSEIDREIHKILETKKQDEKNDRKLILSDNTLIVLEKYKLKLAAKKVKELEILFKRSFNLLHRKKLLIDKIYIDPITFEINLFDVSHNKIVKNNLSSGEKEIYAIALISALAKVSGHSLPFIIDTPLGRLDSKHRLNLIKNFFPHASHQMIIFSTNTEVDKDLFKALDPYLARSYNIEYDQKLGVSNVDGGYFWK